MSVTAAQALDLLDSLGAAGVPAIVDGGRGVDALLGEQTRVHDDLDLVVPVDRAPAAVRLLRGAGVETERDLLPTGLALRHPDGRGSTSIRSSPSPTAAATRCSRTASAGTAARR